MFCKKCGNELPDGSNFCPKCGTRTDDGSKEPRGINCPNCGAPLASFSDHCKYCGFEIREVKSSESLKEFEEKFTAIDRASSKKSRWSVIKNLASQEQKASLISAFPIPNTREDIIEFAVMAAANSKTDVFSTSDVVANAWLSKLEQTYTKAKIVFKDGPELQEIKKLYFKSKNAKRNKLIGLVSFPFALTVFFYVFCKILMAIS